MMKTEREVNPVRTVVKELPTPRVLVPTMGALHAGHRTLLRSGRKLAGPKGALMVSLFVNPLQFDREEDLKNYPTTLVEDSQMCAEEGADLLFTPEKNDLYSPDHSVLVTENRLGLRLCGKSRPGHFDGVLTVVLKLFNLLQPDMAVFGEKDFQQLAMIRRMVRDLNVPVEIISVPTVRERDGLALSSRNVRLSTEQRADAARLHRALTAAKSLLVTGEQDPEKYLATAGHHLRREAPADFKTEYLELLDAETLEPVPFLRKPAVLTVAASYGEVRLIDNVILHPSPFSTRS